MVMLLFNLALKNNAIINPGNGGKLRVAINQ